ncbi:hypothetical protein [Pseudanabaena sp. UWO310]|uniref:hypothetical protein n=1 Tax=Pseudanabaena sp. UWO310 TaxID=2480795 RepID=UPI001CC216AB|nr:hypothetical protein [Pseudanabaena sp. UWO310]
MVSPQSRYVKTYVDLICLLILPIPHHFNVSSAKAQKHSDKPQELNGGAKRRHSISIFQPTDIGGYEIDAYTPTRYL